MGSGLESDRWRSGSVFTEGVEFTIPMTDQIVKWWETRFGRYDMFPKDLCSFLVADLPFARTCQITGVDLDREIVCVEIQGIDALGEVYLTARSVEFAERQVHLNMTDLRTDVQGHGYGTLLARNCYRLARRLELDRLGVTAIGGGSYVWARAGFLPTHKSWNDERCKQRIANHLIHIPELDWETANNVYTMLGSDDEQTMWDLSDLEERVRSCYRPDKLIPLGRALLAESGASWKGTLEMNENDTDSHAEQLMRARSYLGLDASE